jgi:hypothetical protein
MHVTDQVISRERPLHPTTIPVLVRQIRQVEHGRDSNFTVCAPYSPYARPHFNVQITPIVNTPCRGLGVCFGGVGGGYDYRGRMCFLSLSPKSFSAHWTGTYLDRSKFWDLVPNTAIFYTTIIMRKYPSFAC